MRTRSRFRFTLSTLAAALVVLSCGSASRADLEFTGSSGNYSAEADFSLSGNTLTVTLTNTSETPVSANGDTLGGLFFNSTTSLTALSAALNSGSSIALGSIKDNVGEGWLYGSGTKVSSQVTGYNSTIAAAGYTMGFKDTSAQPFYKPTVGSSPGKADYALVGPGGISTKHPGLKSPLFENSIVFTFTVGDGFSLSELGKTVRFQMGTKLTETSYIGTLTAVPEPSTMVIAALGALGFIGYGLRRRSTK